MSDAVERAAEVIDHDAFNVDWSQAHDPRDHEQGRRRRRDALRAAQRLADAGLLASEEREREVAARALREAAEYLNETYRSDGVLEPDVDDLSAHLLIRRADRIESEKERDADA